MCCARSVASQSGSTFASRFQLSLSQLPLPIQDSRWQTSPCVTPQELVCPPFLFLGPSSGIYFLFVAAVILENAKSEIEEVTHVICLATVCYHLSHENSLYPIFPIPHNKDGQHKYF